MNRNIKRLTEGAMMCGLIGVLLVINRQFANAFDAYMMWIVPLPVIVYTVRYGVKNGFVVTFCSTVITFMLALPQTIFYVSASCILGVVYGYGVRKEKSNAWLLTSAILSSTVIMIFTVIIFAGIFGYDLNSELQMIIEIMNSMEISIGNAGILRTLLYASLFLTCLLEGFLIHMLAFIVLTKLKIKVNKFVPLLHYYVPKWFAYVGVLSVIGNWIVPYFTQNTRILEILVCVSGIYLVIAALFGYLLVMLAIRISKNKMGILVFFALLVVFFKYVILLLGILGILDMFTDIRQQLLRRLVNEKQNGIN